MNLVFDYPFVLVLLLVEFILFMILHFKKRRGGRLLLSINVWGGENLKLKSNGYAFWLYVSVFMFWTAMTLIVVAAAAPQKVEKEKIYRDRGKDIMILLDESPSMFSRDLGESRFDIAKEQIEGFISLRENDSIGLITYSSEAVLRVPLTMDYSALRQKIHSMEHRDNHLGNGTDIGMALAFACYHLNNSSGEEKIIILITDGLDNGGLISPLEAAKEAKKMGVRIFPIGLGNFKEEVALSIKDQSGNILQGETNTKRNDSLLKQIAAITGGQFDSSSSISVMEEILREISSTVPSNPEGRIERLKVPIAQPMIAIALALFIGVMIIRKIVLRELL